MRCRGEDDEEQSRFGRHGRQISDNGIVLFYSRDSDRGEVMGLMIDGGLKTEC